MTQHELNKHKNHHLVLPPTESHTSEYSEAHLADSTPYTPAPSFQCWEISIKDDLILLHFCVMFYTIL